MQCPKCAELVEESAVFCGNCGAQIRPTSEASQPAPAVPSYAIATPATHRGETEAVLGVVIALLGIVGSLFMPLIGLSLGIGGLVLATLAWNSPKRHLSTIGIALSSLAVVAGLATWAYAISQQQSAKKAAATQSANATASDVSTPCYSAGFGTRLTIRNLTGSCDMSAYNGATMERSTDLYKVYANKANFGDDIARFQATAKAAVEKDIAQNLPGFTIDRQQLTTFAGSPAYVAYASDPDRRIAAVEAVVLHQTSSDKNVFVLVHASNGDMADLVSLESQWQWR